MEIFYEIRIVDKTDPHDTTRQPQRGDFDVHFTTSFLSLTQAVAFVAELTNLDFSNITNMD